jgi:hypothetical protein
MAGRGIPLVQIKSVLGKFLVKPAHQPVAMDLGNNRSRYDREETGTFEPTNFGPTKRFGSEKLTDPDSKIMKVRSTNSFEQCYNGQAMVDDLSQVIVAGNAFAILVARGLFTSKP